MVAAPEPTSATAQILSRLIQALRRIASPATFRKSDRKHRYGA